MIGAATLKGMRRGIEKESLRVRPDGRLAATPHPKALGSALTHPHITTDFSESQLELITGIWTSADDCLRQVREASTRLPVTGNGRSAAVL
jgi:glutamate--cysteine ligase